MVIQVVFGELRGFGLNDDDSAPGNLLERVNWKATQWLCDTGLADQWKPTL
jgi:hypothetical protein